MPTCQFEGCQSFTLEGHDFCSEHLIVMTESNVMPAVKQIISEHLGVPYADIQPTSRIMANLGADSMDTIELVMAFEELLGEEISDQDAEKIITVNDLCNLVVERLVASGSYAINPIDPNRAHVALTSNVLKQIDTILGSAFFQNYLHHFKLVKESVIKLWREQIGVRWIEHVTTVPDYDDGGALVAAHVVVLTKTHLFYFKLQNLVIFTLSESLENMIISLSYEYDTEGQLISISTFARSTHYKEGDMVGPLRFSFSQGRGIQGATEFFAKYLKFKDRQ
jgi:acyl carrier protein